MPSSPTTPKKPEKKRASANNPKSEGSRYNGRISCEIRSMSVPTTFRVVTTIAPRAACTRRLGTLTAYPASDLA